MRDVPLDVSGLRTNDHVEFRGLRFEVSYVDPSIEPTRRVIHLTRFRQQVERRMKSAQATPIRPVDDIEAIEREVDKLKEQASRYNTAYGAGVFTLEQLRECVTPLNEKIKGLEARIAEAGDQRQVAEADVPPSAEDIERFASKARECLSDLNFEQKRAIVMNTVDKVVGTQQELKVSGYISIPQHVELRTSDRHGLSATPFFAPQDTVRLDHPNAPALKEGSGLRFSGWH